MWAIALPVVVHIVSHPSVSGFPQSAPGAGSAGQGCTGEGPEEQRGEEGGKAGKGTEGREEAMMSGFLGFLHLGSVAFVLACSHNPK